MDNKKIAKELVKIARIILGKEVVAHNEYYVEVKVHETLTFNAENDILDIVKKDARDAKSGGTNDHGSWFEMTIESGDLEGLQEAVNTLSRWYLVSKVMEK